MRADADDDRRLAGGAKKNVESALLELARSGRTTNALLSDILLARMVNQAAGGAVIAPWEVGLLDEATLDACRALAFDLPELRNGLQKAEQRLTEAREKHPTYRK